MSAETTAIIQAVSVLGVSTVALWLLYRFFVIHYWPALQKRDERDHAFLEKTLEQQQKNVDNFVDALRVQSAGFGQITGALTELKNALQDMHDGQPPRTRDRRQ